MRVRAEKCVSLVAEAVGERTRVRARTSPWANGRVCPCAKFRACVRKGVPVRAHVVCSSDRVGIGSEEELVACGAIGGSRRRVVESHRYGETQGSL